jgi:arylsulfatase A-like enzyme
VDDTSVIAGVDLVPTICKVAEVPVPAEHTLDGEDVSDIWRGRSRARSAPLCWNWRFRIMGHVWNVSPQLAVRDGDWKLCFNPDGSRVELYDIPRDRMEVQNVADRHPEIVTRLREKGLAWYQTLPAGPIETAAGRNAYPWPGVGKDR